MATATTAATSNPLLKTLSISTPLYKPTSNSVFYPKPTKTISLTIQKPTFLTTLFVAQTSDWEQDSAAVLDGDENVNVSVSEDWNSTEEGFVGGETVSQEVGFPEPSEDAKLYVGNLPYDVDSEKLANLFDAAGVVEIAEVIYNRETERSRGFGFVTMSTVEEADKAVEMFSGYDVNGRSLVVNKAAPRGARVERAPREYAPSFRIYVGNLPWDVDSDRLEQLFSEHGKVLSARVVSDRDTGRSRGFAFVTMASETEMNDAIAALDGQSVNDRSIRVNVAEERPRRAF